MSSWAWGSAKLARANLLSLKMYLFRLIIILIVSLLSACGTSASPEKATRQISEADAGRQVELRVGDILELTLPANPTTGYQWESSDLDSAILRPVSEQTFEPSSNAVGSGGQVKLRFEAVGTGQTQLKLILHRSFEKDAAPIQNFEITVLVK
jgi:inhibitor of cysteine peptidase